MNWDYIIKHCTAFNSLPCGVSSRHDDLLYRIGSHIDVLTPQDCTLIAERGGTLTAENRYELLRPANAEVGVSNSLSSR